MSRATLGAGLGALDLAALPLLTSRRACLLADCSRTTLQRSGPNPIGKRGRTFVYATADIIAWLSTGVDADRKSTSPRSAQKRTLPGATSARALERLAAIRRGGAGAL